MADEIKSNLEPIEESDLNLKEKFTGGAEIKKGAEDKVENKEIISPAGGAEIAPEKAERKEGAVERESTYSKILSKVGAQAHKTTGGEEVKSDAEAANAGMDAESKITNLVNLAQTKGIPHAVKVARHMEDNYTLDEFHDRMLAEELHNALVGKGMIKEI